MKSLLVLFVYSYKIYSYKKECMAIVTVLCLHKHFFCLSLTAIADPLREISFDHGFNGVSQSCIVFFPVSFLRGLKYKLAVHH